jgi:hypothetical protein
MRKIHLIEKRGLFQRIDGNIYESGYWDISTQTADELIGGDIHFHKKQKEPSLRVSACGGLSIPHPKRFDSPLTTPQLSHTLPAL